MDEDSSSMEFHDVEECSSPTKSLDSLASSPKEKKKKKYGSLTFRRKSHGVETDDAQAQKSATLPRKKRQTSLNKLFTSFGKKKSREEVASSSSTTLGSTGESRVDFGCSRETVCEIVRLDSDGGSSCTSPAIGLRRSSLIGLKEDPKKLSKCTGEEDSSDSFKSAGSPELRNLQTDRAVSALYRGEQQDIDATLSETAFTVFAQSTFVKQLTSAEPLKKKKSAWKRLWTKDRKIYGEEEKIMNPNTVKKEKARGRGSTPLVNKTPAATPSTSSESAEKISTPPSPQPDQETVRKSVQIGSQIIQQKKEEEKQQKVSGDDLRKQLSEGLKNGSGKAKDVKAQISDITQNAVKTSAVASEAFLESEKKDKSGKPDTAGTQDLGSVTQGGPKSDPPTADAGASTSNFLDQIVPPPESKKEHLYKILVIGELGTGKTSIIKRYVHQFFSQHYRATIGVDFALKVLNWDENSIIRLQLWDIAGQERFGNMTRVYYKEAVGAFIVFDVTRAATFDAVQKWKQDLDSKVQLSDGSQIPCILLANKCDQPKEGIVNNKNKMDDYCKEHGFAGWFETSAKENINIEDAAKSLVIKILQNDKLIKTGERGLDDRIALDGTSESGSSKNCSC